MSENHASDHVTERAADRNCRKKKRHYAAARFDRKQVGENGGRGGTVSSFAHSDEYPGEKQDSKSRRQAGTGSGEAPEPHRQSDNYPARKTIREPTQRWRDEHVSNEERAAENAADRERVFVSRQKERGADGWFYGGQDLPIDVIKNVNGQQERDCDARAGFRGGIVRRHRINNCTELPRPCKP